MDLTTLNADDTPGRVERLCAKARHPVQAATLRALGAEELPIRPAAVCVYHAFVETAVRGAGRHGHSGGRRVDGVPHGLAPLETRIREIELSVAAGAREIDIVIERGLVLTGDWQALYDQVRAFRAACGEAHLKTILGTGEAGDAAERRQGLAGLHAGGRRFHQNFHRQGKGQRHPAGIAGDGPDDPLVQ